MPIAADRPGCRTATCSGDDKTPIHSHSALSEGHISCPEGQLRDLFLGGPHRATVNAAEVIEYVHEGVTFGVLLLFLRRRAGLSQADLSRRSGPSARALRDLEHGRAKAAQQRSAELLADWLRLSGKERSAFLARPEPSSRGHGEPVSAGDTQCRSQPAASCPGCLRRPVGGAESAHHVGGGRGQHARRRGRLDHRTAGCGQDRARLRCGTCADDELPSMVDWRSTCEGRTRSRS